MTEEIPPEEQNPDVIEHRKLFPFLESLKVEEAAAPAEARREERQLWGPW